MELDGKYGVDLIGDDQGGGRMPWYRIYNMSLPGHDSKGPDFTLTPCICTHDILLEIEQR